MIENQLKINGYWWDVFTDLEGKTRTTNITSNQILIGMTNFMSWSFVKDPSTLFTNLRHAMGVGDGLWSATIPDVPKGDTALMSEIATNGRFAATATYIKLATGQGTATGSTLTLVDDQRWEATGWFVGMDLEVTAGTNVGNTRTISGWDYASKTFTFSSSFPNVCDSTTVYRVQPTAHGSVSGAVQIQTTLSTSSALNGETLREQGIVFDVDGSTLPVSLPSGTFVNKIYHAPIAKTSSFQLDRYVRFIFEIPRS